MLKKDIKKVSDRTFFYKDKESITYSLEIAFIYDTSRINNLKCDILSYYLERINSKYKSRKEIADREIELYSPKAVFWNNAFNNQSMFIYSYIMLDYKKVNDNYLDESLEFASDMLFKPFIVDNKLDKDTFKIIKEDIYNGFINSIKDFENDYRHKYNKAVLNGYLDNLISYDTKDELKKDLDSITDKDIIDFYNELLKNHYKTLIYGNLSKNDLDKFINKFSFKNNKKYNIVHEENIDLKSGYNEYVSKDFIQTVLIFTYKNNNSKKFAKEYYANIIGYMANSFTGTLFKILRTKYGLVYGYNYCLIRNSSVVCLTAYIDKKNKDKTIKAVKEFFEQMKDRKVVEERLKCAKEKINENIMLSDEDSREKRYIACDIIFNNHLSNRAYISKVNSVTVDDIIEFYSGLENENIFYYVGDKDE